MLRLIIDPSVSVLEEDYLPIEPIKLMTRTFHDGYSTNSRRYWVLGTHLSSPHTLPLSVCLSFVSYYSYFSPSLLQSGHFAPRVNEHDLQIYRFRVEPAP